MDDGMTREQAEEEALRYSARPGTSEHQTGLCLDFMTTQMSDLDESFEDTSAFRWLSSNAHKYGFILRYPSNKVDTTGYKYEPWHYRFVGRSAATEIYESGLCLEEYLELN
jgi:D-alanyl-D-alanine carboxypeptidase